jgi:glycosyltransferase involved in cell wall biosynthesis
LTRRVKFLLGMKKIGFSLPLFGTNWIGGLNYFRNLFSVMNDVAPGRYRPVVVVGHERVTEAHISFPSAEIVGTPLLTQRHPQWLMRKLSERVLGADPFLEGLLRQHDVELFSHSSPLGRTGTLPTFAWVPDFQQMRLPHLFSVKERRARDNNYRIAGQWSDRVILSSRSSADDFMVFQPEQAHKSVVLRFTVPPIDVLSIMGFPELRELYAIPNKFLYLPNQYWVHKNHAVVIGAIRLLRDHYTDFCVISTGSIVEPRDPEHATRLLSEVKELGLEQNYRYLGVVPYPHLQALMLQAHGLINPSRFEGWSTTVEEAKALGKHLALSRIDTHLEQAEGFSRFFDVDSPEECAKSLAELWELSLEREAWQALAARQQERWHSFGLRYMQILEPGLKSQQVKNI